MKKKKNTMKILIPNATSPRNVGDQAILSGLISVLDKHIRLKIHSSEPYLYNRIYKCKISPTLYSWAIFEDTKFISRIKRLSELFLSYFLLKGNITLFKNRNLSLLIDDYVNADIILFVGGGSLRSQKGIKQALNLLMTLFVFQFANLSKAKKIVAPISFGPFAYEWQEKYAAGILKKFNMVMAREQFSYDLLKKYKLSNTLLSTDSSLFLKLKKKNKETKNRNFTLGFTIRKWLRLDLQKQFEEEFISSIESFAKTTHARVQPIVQVDAPEYGDFDADLTEEIAKDLKRKGIKVNPTKKVKDLDRSVEIYSQIDLLLGMRMHSNILASLQGTPFVAISYEHKTEGLSRQLGLGDYCIKVEKADQKTIFANLIGAYKNLNRLEDKIDENIKNIRLKELISWKSELKKLLI